jgi:hypothetical protein
MNMIKSALLGGLLLLSLPLLAQLPTVPFANEHHELVAELSKSFHFSIIADEVKLEEETEWKNWAWVENFTFGKDRGNLPMLTDLEALHPYLRQKVNKLIEQCHEKGIELAVVETYRTVAKQNEYKSMGKKYTRSVGGHSKHQYGLAVDVVPMVDGVAQWDNLRLWRKIGAIGEQLGLRWGGRWKYPFDPGHFEWSGGLSGQQLMKGLYPKVPKSQNFPCLEEELTQLADYWKAWETEQSALVRKEVLSSKMN